MVKSIGTNGGLRPCRVWYSGGNENSIQIFACSQIGSRLTLVADRNCGIQIIFYVFHFGNTKDKWWFWLRQDVFLACHHPGQKKEKEDFFLGFNKYLVYERSILKSMSSGLRPLEGTALKFSGLCLIQFLGGFVLVTDTNLTLPD